VTKLENARTGSTERTRRLPLREFRVFIGNVVNFHRGQPYWQPVNWDIIAIHPAARM
jgi:hypothetical protein